MKENTYTYKARSAEDPKQVMTFTLHDHSMSAELAAPLEHLEGALSAEQSESEAESKAEIQPWLKPVALSVMERVTRPFNIADVIASAEDDWLHVKAWVRAGGLRVAPFVLMMEHVDNPEAAQAFAEEVEQRKSSATYPGRFRGALDYWAIWLLAGLVMGILLWIGLRREEKETA
jgi:hypothetical protein